MREDEEDKVNKKEEEGPTQPKQAEEGSFEEELCYL